MKKILITEDVPATRKWLAQIVRAAFPACEITEATNLRAGLDAIASDQFDLALIDLGLPDGSGLDLLRQLNSTASATMPIVTTVMGDDATVVAALSAGAQGYLLKETPDDIFARQLIQHTEGTPALSPSIARRIMEHFRLTGPAAPPEGELTDREREVLALIGRGLRNADVAQDLGLAESTIASHIKSIYRKLGISSRAEASWHATRMGLTTQKGE